MPDPLVIDDPVLRDDHAAGLAATEPQYAGGRHLFGHLPQRVFPQFRLKPADAQLSWDLLPDGNIPRHIFRIRPGGKLQESRSDHILHRQCFAREIFIDPGSAVIIPHMCIISDVRITCIISKVPLVSTILFILITIRRKIICRIGFPVIKRGTSRDGFPHGEFAISAVTAPLVPFLTI